VFDQCEASRRFKQHWSGLRARPGAAGRGPRPGAAQPDADRLRSRASRSQRSRRSAQVMSDLVVRRAGSNLRPAD